MQDISIYIVHRWDMSALREKVSKELSNQPNCTIADLSYTQEEPVEVDHPSLLQDYLAGQMLNSEVILVLPPAHKGHVARPDPVLDLPLTPFSPEPFAHRYGLKSDSFYVVEMITLMYDTASSKPVVVLGWSEGQARTLAEMINNPIGFDGKRRERGKVHYFSLDTLKNYKRLSKLLIRLVSNK